ncbi:MULTISPECIES: TAXI family TRAP transporter solute-binding subunit [Tepidibacillus]|uniref:C4-dicarboxylate ABC transporter substrate-binding protein n=1 Tax=Tepidibacillus decaturensis TaxID=1413211 RepID=A0A135L1J6_9BACI|nr:MULTISPECIES: TAXI family TRAP transporter solute-binding subunit [Tepidibacillus]KXG42749.1 C4-dicarboxylate ABC transporter substrate-binding protein [Tepidibacillus decaturensis]GBF12339.1 hypothetical protein HK1_02400 [Tepidibacillus sp. HK-1]
MRKKGLKMIAMIVMISMIIGLVGCSSSTTSSNGGGGMKFINIATASTGGSYYPIGVGMATLWTEKLKGVNASAQSSAGSVENIDLLRNGEAQIAIFQGLIGSMAYQGKGAFEGKKYDGLRSISMLWPNVEHFVLKEELAKTGNILDLKGSNFSVGPQASGTEQSTMVIFEGVGLSKADIKPDYLGYNDAASAIKDGRISGASMPAGTPVAAVTDLYASKAGVKVLEFTDEQLASINKLYNTWFRFVIPVETYPGQKEEIKTIAQPNWLGVANTVDEKLVYDLTKTLFENLDYMYSVHNSAKSIKLETSLNGLPAPLHIGAYKYFKEKGLEIPEHLIPPEAK